MKVVIEADGGSRGNPGPAGYGAVVLSEDRSTVLAEAKRAIGRATNNVAEYRGLIAGLADALDLGATEAAVFLDSKLLVEQMSGRWKVKHPDLKELHAEARALAPSILFIDEIDGIGKRQPAAQEYADYWNTVVNKALELLDGAVKSEGLVIVGATNRPDQIDDAIKRSGRLETHIEIPLPDVATLAEILAYHVGDDVAALVGDKKLVSTEMGEEKPDVTGMTDEPPAANSQASEDSGEQGSEEARKGAAK